MAAILSGLNVLIRSIAIRYSIYMTRLEHQSDTHKWYPYIPVPCPRGRAMGVSIANIIKKLDRVITDVVASPQELEKYTGIEITISNRKIISKFGRVLSSDAAELHNKFHSETKIHHINSICRFHAKFWSNGYGNCGFQFQVFLFDHYHKKSIRCGVTQMEKCIPCCRISIS